MSRSRFFVGVDVGTGSARACLVSDAGKIVKVAVRSIQTWNPLPDHYEQSSDDIWNACTAVINDVRNGVPKENIKGIGFDATCSLVAVSENSSPLSISTTGNPQQNIILWMDHRATEEAQTINATHHSILKYVGGKVSLEMQMPKLLWLKKHLPKTWMNADYFFDLPDFLTWKATGCDSRSLCSVVCKWNYEVDDAGKRGWNKDFLDVIGLGELVDDDFKKIGDIVKSPGDACGCGVSAGAAEELGLLPGTPVGTSIIDAHAGGLGMIGCLASGISSDVETRLSLICGTSTCHMAVNEFPVFVPGVWGPYFSAMLPEFWLSEAGQSASGVLIEHVINTHPAIESVKRKCQNGMLPQDYLKSLIDQMSKEQHLPCSCFLTQDVHMWPDFHGNRSPLADPELRGMLSGLRLASDERSLALIYLATIQALAYGTKHIMEALCAAGHREFKSILICGGLARNELFVQTQADALGLPLLRPKESESVLLGAAILGARAANCFPDIQTAITKMAGDATVVCPNKIVRDYHEKKYKVFLKMLQDQISYKKMME